MAIQSGSILNDRYVIEAPIGQGGMATVYRAQDLETKEHVAVKVMREELAHAVGAKRFQQEIAIASSLEHPNVVSLTDAGSSDDALYCVMPLFEGETLRQRLDREGQLPVDEALAITEAVARALDFAHDRDIVHRDVKPENILLSGDRVGLADFGIAQSLERAEEDGKLTSTGVVLGTVTYMSPEQASADKVDRRTDVYALGCVLYEMLAGEPPFTGPTKNAIMARHVNDPVPDLRTVRPGLPDPVWFAVQKAMAKSPADRFKTAGDFVAATRKAASPAASRKRAWILGAAALVLAAAIVTWLATRPPPLPPLDRSLVAVLPFSLRAPDESDRWLATAFPVNIAELLDGTGGLQSASWTRTELALDGIGRTWKDDLSAAEAREVARRLGAGLYVAGSVLSDGTQRIATITLIDTETGEEVNRAREEITELGVGSAVDRALAALFVDIIDQARQSESLFGQSPEAFRAYVDGWMARREQRHADAVQHFRQAVLLDTTFALAALAWEEAALWLPDGSELRDTATIQLVHEVYTNHVDRLPPLDQQLLRIRLATPPTRRDTLAMWEELARIAPDRPDIWLRLGDHLYHEGLILDIPNFRERSAAAFESTLALGEFTPEVQRHLDELRFDQGDTEFIRAYLDRPDKPGVVFDPLHWAGAWLVGDSALIEQYGEAIDTLPGEALQRMLRYSKYFVTGFPQADRAAVVLEDRGGTPGVSSGAFYGDLASYQLNRGRPQWTERLYRARYGGNRADAANAMLVLAHFPTWPLGQPPVSDVTAWLADYEGLALPRAHCALAFYAATMGDKTGARDHLEVLQNTPDSHWDHPMASPLASSCARVVTAALADENEVDATLDEAARILDANPNMLRVYLSGLGLALATLFEKHGRPEDGLRFVSRTSYFSEEAYYLTQSLLLEGRLSLEAGDTARAITALEKAVALLSDPEPSMEPVAREARETLSELLAR